MFSLKRVSPEIVVDDAQKISRLNAPGFNGLEVAWKA